MRNFIVLGHDAPLSPDFSLNDLPGSAGRLDLLCRCVTNGLLQSHDIRADTTVRTIHQDELVLGFSGDSISRLNPDERSTAARFRDALETAKTAVGPIPIESAPGITVARTGLETTIDAIDTPLVLLDPAGDPLPTLDPTPKQTFVLSDHHSFSASEREFLEAKATERISLGPVPLHADQAITVMHNYLDTDGFTSY